jgi:hypothetical protein
MPPKPATPPDAVPLQNRLIALARPTPAESVRVHLPGAGLGPDGHPQRDDPHGGRPDRSRAARSCCRAGKVAAIGSKVDAPADALVVDATGKWVTPGIIDTHSHMGVYAAPGIEALADGNEMTSPNTAEVSAEHAIWPQDPQFDLALAGGVTTMHVLPGSANLFGGRSVTLKNVPARTAEGMKFPGAPYGLKMACGENPKRVYGGRNTTPGTRMGNVAGLPARLAVGRGVPRALAPLAREGRDGRPGRSATSSGRRWPVCSTARSVSRTTATVPTRWRS